MSRSCVVIGSSCTNAVPARGRGCMHPDVSEESPWSNLSENGRPTAIFSKSLQLQSLRLRPQKRIPASQLCRRKNCFSPHKRTSRGWHRQRLSQHALAWESFCVLRTYIRGIVAKPSSTGPTGKLMIDRWALVGRNGAGKSTLIRLLLGQEEPDLGTVWQRPGSRIAHLRQDDPFMKTKLLAIF